MGGHDGLHMHREGLTMNVQRIAALEARLDAHKRKTRNDLWPYSHVTILANSLGWAAYVDHMRVGDAHAATADEAMDGAERHVDAIVNADQLLAQTLGVA